MVVETETPRGAVASTTASGACDRPPPLRCRSNRPANRSVEQSNATSVHRARVAKWSTAADSRPAPVGVRRFESGPSQYPARTHVRAGAATAGFEAGNGAERSEGEARPQGAPRGERRSRERGGVTVVRIRPLTERGCSEGRWIPGPENEPGASSTVGVERRRRWTPPRPARVVQTPVSAASDVRRPMVYMTLDVFGNLIAAGLCAGTLGGSVTAELPGADDAASSQSIDSRPGAAAPGLTGLRSVVVAHDGQPDRRTVYPAGASAEERLTRWISADDSAFVPLDRRR